jgi:hypothetical protein
MNNKSYRRRFLQAGAAGLLLPIVPPLFALTEANAPSSISEQSCTDCTDWLTRHLKSRSEAIRLPAGNFSVSRPFDITGTSIAGAGADLTRLVYTGPEDVPFLSVGCSRGSSAEVRDLSLIRAGSGGGTAIGITKAGACYFEHRRRILIDNVNFCGAEIIRSPGGWLSAPSWLTCIELGDAWGTHISRVDAIGGYDIRQAPSQADRCVFLRTGAVSGILSARISGVTAASFYRGIEIGPKTFFFIADCDFAACYDGIVSVHGVNDGFSEGRIRDTMINAQHVGIHLKNSAWRAVSGVAINRHKEGYKQGDWTGIQLDGVFKSWIGKMRFQVDSTRGAFEGQAVGIALNKCSDLIISEVMFGQGLTCDIVQENSMRILTPNNVNHTTLQCRR